MKKSSILILLALFFTIDSFVVDAAGRHFSSAYDVGLQVLFTSPDHGVPGGNEMVKIVGVNFKDGAQVVWNGQSIKATFIDSNFLAVTTPAGQPGKIAVSVTNPDGEQANLNNAFTYNGQPAMVKLISPNSKSVFSADGATVTISWKIGQDTIYSSARQRLLLSTDSGATFPIVLADNLNATIRKFDLVIPSDLITHNARLRLEVVQLGLIASDETATDFKIVTAPQLNEISPTTSKSSDAPFDLTISGSGFNSSSQVEMDNNILKASRISSNKIIVSNFSASRTGVHFIRVHNGDGGISRNFLFTVAQ